MKDRLVAEISEKMDKFFEAVTDDEFVAILDDLDWKHYATLGRPTVLETQYCANAKPLVNVAPKPWSIKHRSVPIKNSSQKRLAA